MRITAKSYFTIFGILFSIIIPLRGQIELNSHSNVRFALPFLTITPDARSMGMGYSGVASKPDVNSQYWNIAKYAFLEKKAGISMNYSPYMRTIIPGLNQFYLVGFFKINDKNILSSSLNYFTLGKITYTNSTGNIAGYYRPKRISFDLGYSRYLNDHFSAGITARYIHSEVGPDITMNSYAVDFGLYYQNHYQLMRFKEFHYAYGLNISNVGPKISYSTDERLASLPTKLSLGGRISLEINKNLDLSFNADFNKYLVPTSPIYENDTIVRGMEAPESALLTMVQSFYDAPGVLRNDTYSVFLEELTEVFFGIGTEISYKNTVYFRTGYFYQHEMKGNVEVLTLGIGLNDRNVISFDFSYVIPIKESYEKTFGVSITYNFPTN